MSEAVLEAPIKTSTSIVLRFNDALRFTDDEFFELCAINRDLRLERTAEGDIIVMPPTGGTTGNRNQEITRQGGNWTKADGGGAAFDSSTGFRLPNGADRSPDFAWVARARLAALTPQQKQKFLPLCPDFVIELKSPTDTLADIQAKMREYMENGAQLGWLIDPETRRVHIYRPGVEPEVLENPERVAGEEVVSGFTLELAEIWQPNL